MTKQINTDRLVYGWRDPVEPRPAATVLVFRDSDAGGIELLMTRRSMSASFAPGAYVFPGGRVDDADFAFARELSNDPEQHGKLAFTLAAIREAFEELGILLARDASGHAVDKALVATLDRNPSANFAQQMRDSGLQAMVDEVLWFSHWITDRDLPKRFDTRFYVAKMPPGQTPVPDNTEQFAPEWVVPAEALERHERGEFDMIFPTIRTLRQLQGFDSFDAIRAEIESSRPMWKSCPRAGYRQGKVERFSENEAPYGELELVCPDGKVEHDLTWRHQPVPLLRHVIRVTAPNPGRMTGPGTNTYIIGAPGDYIVVDPGPDIDSHLNEIASVVGDGLSAVICTHAHPDHYPGAIPLRERVGKPDAPILGRPTGPHFNPAWKFTPDRVLEDNECIEIGTDVLRVLHTPGHASNHVCLLLEPDGLLISGDHILNGSTTVIDHPDGDMKAYMDSLHRLAGEPISYILPAHGHVLGNPIAEIERLIAHRLGREAKVWQALSANPGTTIDTLVVHAYDDVDPVLHPVAKRSLSAHLHKLAADNRAQESAGVWTPSS